MKEEQINIPLDFQPEEVKATALEILRKDRQKPFDVALKEAFTKLGSNYKDHTSMYLQLVPEIKQSAREIKLSRFLPKGIETDQF